MPEYRLSQMDLVLELSKVLGQKKYGVKSVSLKQMNALCQAAQLIVDKFREPHIQAVPWMGADAWMNCDDAGASSKFLLYRLSGGRRGRNEYAVPHDNGDLNRCRLMIPACAEVMPKIPLESHFVQELVMQHPEWGLWIEKLQSVLDPFPPILPETSSNQ